MMPLIGWLIDWPVADWLIHWLIMMFAIFTKLCWVGLGWNHSIFHHMTQGHNPTHESSEKHMYHADDAKCGAQQVDLFVPPAGYPPRTDTRQNLEVGLGLATG